MLNDNKIYKSTTKQDNIALVYGTSKHGNLILHHVFYALTLHVVR